MLLPARGANVPDYLQEPPTELPFGCMASYEQNPFQIALKEGYSTRALHARAL